MLLIVILVASLLYVLAPLSEEDASKKDKAKEEVKERLQIVGAFLLIAVVMMPDFFMTGTKNTEGDGGVNLFLGEAKNYRVDAKMIRHNKPTLFPGFLGIKYDYTIKEFYWPSGEADYFDPDCILKDGNRTECTDTSGEKYTVEFEYFSLDGD